jgi:hypothetical protein
MSQLDPVVEKDLNAIEAALAEGRVTATDAGERELQELALLLESDAPRPDPDFAAELDDLVQDGFPRERRFSLPRLPKRRLTRLHAASGIAAAAVLAGILVVSLGGGDEDQAGPDALSAPQTLQAPEGDVDESGSIGRRATPLAESVDKAGGAELAAPEPPIGGGNFRPGKRERRIERSASLTLAAPGDKLDRVAERIQAVTDRYGGFVLRSSITSGDEGGEGGSFELRIPADRLQPALRDLAALGEVRSRTQSGQDVTPEFVTAADRLEGARAERKSLLRRLENATTDTEAEALRRRLDLNAGEIRGLRSQLRSLNLRTNYAAVNLSLVKDGDEGSGGGGSSGIDDALDDALGSLTDSIGIALRVLGVAIPLTLVGGLAWWSATLWRRRRREAALG